MSAADRLIVALDVNSREAALALCAALRPKVRHYKIGLELFTACGPDLVRDLLRAGAQIFLDLKLHDIPNTAARAAVEAARLGVGMFTIHLSGGPLMARRVADEVTAHCEIHGTPRPRILGVTVLTSLAQQDLASVGVTRSLEEQVVALAEMAGQAGLDGVVASPREVGRLRAVLGPEMTIVTPGVRLAGGESQDQARTLTPREAVAAGADYIVAGRPILSARDPLEAAETILLQIEGR
ncbi:MAG TPA: orotidine-5'-phosphate decarboxylase [Candidatus Cryosericum sp.]|nr:orotidine-5'-phosphate decarboxylase [Candidatus Cryosericum sp.]